jgi:hypothetical protein
MNNLLDLDFLAAVSLAAPTRSAPLPSGPARPDTLSAPTKTHEPMMPSSPSLRTPGLAPQSFRCEMDAAEYHTQAPGISSSRLKHMLVSPAFYQLMLKRPMLETDALRLGRMLHTQVLEPHLIDEEFAIWRDGRRQGGEWELFNLMNAGKTILTEAQLACAQDMAQALRELGDFPFEAWLNGLAGIAPALKEQSLFWIDEETGLQCKARPDAMTLGTSALAGDVKSARSADPEEFVRDLFRFRYDLQAAHYLAGIQAVYGVHANFAFFTVEKEAPHVARTFLMTQEALAHGEKHRRYCLRMIKKCLLENSWPKQPAGTMPVAVEVPFYRDKSLLDRAAAYGISL